MDSIDGKKIAEEIIKKLKSQPKPEKILAAILLGQNPACLSFLKQKTKISQALGADFRIYNFPESIKNDDLRKEVNKIASLKKVGGVIVQLPLPNHLNPQYVLNVIPREKDIDVLGERGLGAFYNGRNPVLPPSVGVVIEIIENCKLKIENLRVAVVGLGFLVGKPIAVWLTSNSSTKLGARCPEIYLLDQGSDFEILKQADLVISGVGKARLIKPEMLKNDASIIDFGYDIVDEKIYGDFDYSQLSNSPIPQSTNFYTPTPSGTGPILVAKLFENFYKLNHTK